MIHWRCAPGHFQPFQEFGRKRASDPWRSTCCCDSFGTFSSTTQGDNWLQQYPGNEVMICCLVNTLELLGTYSDMTVVERRAVKTNNKLWCGNRRDTVKFVLKRLPCTCLKKLHSVTRMKFAKMGVCNGCLKSYTRSQLRVCTGCMVAEYCSKECQRAHWSYHKGGCGNPEISSRDLPADYVVLESRRRVARRNASPRSRSGGTRPSGPRLSGPRPRPRRTWTRSCPSGTSTSRS